MSLGITWSRLKTLHSAMLAEAKPGPWAVAAVPSRGAHKAAACLLLCCCCLSAGATSVPCPGHLLILYLPYLQWSLGCCPSCCPPIQDWWEHAVMSETKFTIGDLPLHGGTEGRVCLSVMCTLIGTGSEISFNFHVLSNEPWNTQLMPATECERNYSGWKCVVSAEDES